MERNDGLLQGVTTEVVVHDLGMRDGDREPRLSVNAKLSEGTPIVTARLLGQHVTSVKLRVAAAVINGREKFTLHIYVHQNRGMADPHTTGSWPVGSDARELLARMHARTAEQPRLAIAALTLELLMEQPLAVRRLLETARSELAVYRRLDIPGRVRRYAAALADRAQPDRRAAVRRLAEQLDGWMRGGAVRPAAPVPGVREADLHMLIHAATQMRALWNSARRDEYFGREVG